MNDYRRPDSADSQECRCKHPGRCLGAVPGDRERSLPVARSAPCALRWHPRRGAERSKGPAAGVKKIDAGQSQQDGKSVAIISLKQKLNRSRTVWLQATLKTPRGRDRSERRVQCTRRASRLRLEVIWLASRVPAGRCDRVCAPYLCRGPAAACTWMPCDVCGTGCASGVCSTPWRWRAGILVGSGVIGGRRQGALRPSVSSHNPRLLGSRARGKRL